MGISLEHPGRRWAASEVPRRSTRVDVLRDGQRDRLPMPVTTTHLADSHDAL